jgi:hypothetical protein
MASRRPIRRLRQVRNFFVTAQVVSLICHRVWGFCFFAALMGSRGEESVILLGMILPPEVTALIASLQRELEALRAENAELRRRLGLDSSTSSKPPSSDGLRKKPVSLREPSGRASGGQEGAQGRNASPDRRARPDRDARGCGLPALRLPPGPGDGGGDGAASGVRSAGAAARRDRTPGPCLKPAPAAAGAPGRSFRPRRAGWPVMASASGRRRSICTPSN